MADVDDTDLLDVNRIPFFELHRDLIANWLRNAIQYAAMIEKHVRFALRHPVRSNFPATIRPIPRPVTLA